MARRNKKCSAIIVLQQPSEIEKYNIELKSKVVAFHLSKGRSMSSLEKEYNLSKGCVSNWIKSYSQECQNNIEKINENDFMYARYNHSRPHSYNGDLSPIQKRYCYKKMPGFSDSYCNFA